MEGTCNHCGHGITGTRLRIRWGDIDYFFCALRCKKRYVRLHFLMVV